MKYCIVVKYAPCTHWWDLAHWSFWFQFKNSQVKAEKEEAAIEEQKLMERYSREVNVHLRRRVEAELCSMKLKKRESAAAVNNPTALNIPR